MANKVIKIQTKQAGKPKDRPAAELNVVYKDVSMVAKPSAYSKSPTKAEQEDYLLYLSREFADAEEEYNYVICAEFLSEEEKKSLAITYKSVQDYEKALDIWKKRSRFNVDSNINVRAIQGSIRNIFTWVPGERVLLPEFGSNLQRLLYEGITDFNVEQIMAEIRHSISEWEPRVVVDKVVDESRVDDTECNTVRLAIVYRIPGLSEEQYRYSFECNRQS